MSHTKFTGIDQNQNEKGNIGVFFTIEITTNILLRPQQKWTVWDQK